jgi:RNA recognition motif-containing protein
MNIYVGNLPYRITEDELSAAFEAYGEVSSANIIRDRETGRSKGFGFIEMPDDEQAKAAIQALDNSDLQGRNVKVNEARPKQDRPARAPRY